MNPHPKIGWANLIFQIVWIADKVGKIQAVKHARDHAGLGLKDAKEFVDSVVLWQNESNDAAMTYPDGALPTFNASSAHPEWSKFELIVAEYKKNQDYYEGKKQAFSEHPKYAVYPTHKKSAKWDHPASDPLADIVAVKKKMAQALYGEDKDDAGPSNPRLAELVREYRPTMDAEVLHAWARDVMTELSKLD